MLRKFIKRFFPETNRVKEHRFLKVFGEILHRPEYWHFHPRSIARAFAIGTFSMCMPIPFQMILSAALALIFRANILIAVALVWLTNPITTPPLLYFFYKLGCWILPTCSVSLHFQASFDWMLQELSLIWMPFLVGSLISAVILSVMSYLIVRFIWYLAILKRLRKQKKRKLFSFKKH